MLAFYTAGAWIQAFEQAMHDILSARSGPIRPSGRRFHGMPCADHGECVVVQFDGRQEHIAWKDRKPPDVATSLANRYPSGSP